MMGLTETEWMGYLLYTGALALIVIGLFVIATRHHVIRILLGLGLLEAGVNLVLLAAGFRANAHAPILSEMYKAGTPMVDPVPQALILTAIVIGVGVLALALALSLEVIDRHLGAVQLAGRKEFRVPERGFVDHGERCRPICVGQWTERQAIHTHPKPA